MKKFTWFLFVTLALAACSRKSPTPTIPPTPTRSHAPTATARATMTPLASPTPRVTIVPSATRLQPDAQGAAGTPSASPTSTDEPTPTLVPSSTPTTAIIDAGPVTDTPSPTATAPDSPLPAPTQSAASEDAPTETPLPTETPSSGTTPRPTAEAATATDTPTPTPTPTTSSSEDASPTPTFTPTPQPTSTFEPNGQEWSFANVWTYFDEDYQEFYVWGEVVNNTANDLRITSFSPVVYDDDGNILTDEENVTFPWGFEWLTVVSVAPEQHLPFTFVIDRFDDVGQDPIEERYEILIEAELAEPTRDDLEIPNHDYDLLDWPDYFYVEGMYTNPGPDLENYFVVVITLYDEDGFVIGVGGQIETSSDYLKGQEQYFQIEVAMWEVTFDMGLHVGNFKLQLLAQ